MIRDFMLFIGPISSIFDFLTFYVLLQCLDASERLFHTGWFFEHRRNATASVSGRSRRCRMR